MVLVGIRYGKLFVQDREQKQGPGVAGTGRVGCFQSTLAPGWKMLRESMSDWFMVQVNRESFLDKCSS